MHVLSRLRTQPLRYGMPSARDMNVNLETIVLKQLKRVFKTTSISVREYFRNATLRQVVNLVSAQLEDMTVIDTATFDTFEETVEWANDNGYNQNGILYAWQGYGKPDRRACYRRQMEFWTEDQVFTKLGRSTNLSSRFKDYIGKFSQAVQKVTIWVF